MARMMTAVAMAAGLMCSGAVAADLAEHHTASDLAKTTEGLKAKAAKTGSASETLAEYTSHRTVLSYRAANGGAEVHTHVADIFYIVHGKASLVTEGKVENGHEEKPDEIRGSAVTGGKTMLLTAGDVVHIPAGVPHQILVSKGDEIVYFVVKVTEKE
jgi:mannose-6-phosphate isomerase-like protein (cupin superfamily)